MFRLFPSAVWHSRSINHYKFSNDSRNVRASRALSNARRLKTCASLRAARTGRWTGGSSSPGRIIPQYPRGRSRQSGSGIRWKYATSLGGGSVLFPRDDFVGIQSRSADCHFFPAATLAGPARKPNLPDSSHPSTPLPSPPHTLSSRGHGYRIAVDTRQI